jgi:hypothetical protein
MYYKHVTIVNYASSSVNKLKASLNDDARVIIYDRHMFIVHATRVLYFTTVLLDLFFLKHAFFFTIPSCCKTAIGLELMILSLLV